MGPLWAQVNGQLQDGLPLSDRGLAFGDGLFETIRIELGRVPLWPFHLARLRSGFGRWL